MTASNNSSDILTIAEAAKLAKVSPRAIRAAIEDGRLPATRLTPIRGWKISKQALAQLLKVVL